MICANENEAKICPYKGGLHESRKCASCGENHTANYEGCRKQRVAEHVERVRAEPKLSYKNAVQVVQQEASEEMQVGKIPAQHQHPPEGHLKVKHPCSQIKTPKLCTELTIQP